MTALLGALGFLGPVDGRLPDVLPGGLARALGGSLDDGQLVVREADGDGVRPLVLAARPSAFVGEHGPRLAYTPSPESRSGIGIRQTLHGETVSVYAKPMETIELDEEVTDDETPDWDCGSGQCDPNTGCPACSDEDRIWVRAR